MYIAFFVSFLYLRIKGSKAKQLAFSAPQSPIRAISILEAGSPSMPGSKPELFDGVLPIRNLEEEV